ncbi:hypothetical protein OCU04_010531 [Sclerotinia nivalis]|uniref:C2H2-type domain-containing protein n=1 Tax=Sclerotinia nivalis TaxID=352851 RepID=A0A9X0AC96_9HELO|nr:hypothetical protein OCU04_010531 [Sclerotinia nivalis]
MTFACWTCDDTFRFKRDVIWHCQQYGHTRAWVCEHCDKPFGSERSREQHTEDKHEFWCFPCAEVFSTEDALDLHNSTQHYFPCGFGCDRAFSSFQARDQHNNDVHNYRCYDCDQSFRSKQAFEQHEAAYHDFQCKPCEREFRSESALEQHMNSAAHPYRCSKCIKSFPFNSDLQQHIAADHTWKCNQCHLIFDGPNHVDLHIKSEHQVMRCLNCPAKFDRFAELQLHRAQQHSFQCTYCTALPFDTFTLLKQHEASSHDFNVPHVQNDLGMRLVETAILKKHTSIYVNYVEIFDNTAACELHYMKAHRLCCPKCPKTFHNVDEVLQHAPEHMKPVVPADAAPLNQTGFERTALDHHKLKYGQNTCKRCGGMFLKRLDLQNHLANDHGLQLKCLRPDCDHMSTSPNACTRHYFSYSMVKCEKCEGFFDKDKDPELKAHIAKIHTPKPIFGCVQCTRTFESSDAVAQHYSAEHAFICEACPGTFFINSATRERHFATCGNSSETSDSGESFQTPRTEFSPFIQRKALPPVSTKASLPPSQPLVRIHEEFKISRMNAIDKLAQKILAEAKAKAKPTYQCPKCDVPLLEFEEDEL